VSPVLISAIRSCSARLKQSPGTIGCLLLGAVVFAGICVQGAAAQSSHPSPNLFTTEDQATFAQAVSALNAGNIDQAEPLLLQLQVRHPRNYQINEALGLAYASQNQLQRALPLLEAAAQEEPGSDVAHANLGTDYLKLGKTSDAASELQQAVALNARDASSQNALAQAWMLEKQPCKAADAFAAAAALGDTDGDATYNHALALFDCGKIADAASLLTTMPGVDQSAPAQSLLGDIEEALKEYKVAAQHYAQAAQIDPSEENIYVLGIDFLRHWTFPAAIAEFEDGLRAYPASRRLQAGLGIAYYGDTQYDKAIRIFSTLLEKDPDNPIYGDIYGRSCTLLTEGDDPLCAQLTQFAETHRGNAPIAVYAATRILHNPASPQQDAVAESLLHQAIAHDPDSAEAHYQLGFLLQNENQWQQSVSELEKATTLQPKLAPAHYRLGLAYAHLGRRAEAQQQMLLDRQYHQQQQTDLNARLQHITTLLVKLH
jgi:tetratricopeptide (TPR) repeat protein